MARRPRVAMAGFHHIVNQKEFMNIDYPFILQKANAYDEYMAFKLGQCFATGKSFKVVSTVIEKAKGEIFAKPKNSAWGK